MRDELPRDHPQVLENLDGAVVHAGLVVADPVLLAERLHQGVHLPEVVPRDLGEEVVIDLVLQPTAEPVHERRTGDVARRSHLITRVGV